MSQCLGFAPAGLVLNFLVW